MNSVIRSIIYCFCLLPLSMNAQTGTSVPFMAFPEPLENGTVRYALGASMTLLPRQVVEEEIRQIPMVSGTLRYGFPHDLSCTVNFSTVYITNVLSAEAMWSTSIGPVYAALTEKFSYWFGVADMDGFDTKAMGLFTQPGISAGMNVDEYLITVKTDMLVMLSQHTFFGSASVGRVKPQIVGMGTSVTLEQDLWHSTFLAVTLRAQYALPNYQVWLAFSVQDRWMMFPEIQVSLLY